MNQRLEPEELQGAKRLLQKPLEYQERVSWRKDVTWPPSEGKPGRLQPSRDAMEEELLL